MKQLVILFFIFLNFVVFADCSTNSIIFYMDQNQQMLKHKIHNLSHFYKMMNQNKYKKLSALVASKWGKDNVSLSTKSKFVQYKDNFQQRQSIDFKKGKIKLETIVDMNKQIKAPSFQKNLKIFLNETIEQALKNDPLHFNINKYTHNKTTIQSLAPPQKIIITQKQLKEKIVTIDNKPKKIISVEIPMISNHLEKRVKLYLPLVKKYSKKYHLKISYVLGIIHTESYFNPMAISKSQAYGLMQIVPFTGGIDSYFILYGEKKIPSKEFLLNPKNNIELGTNYLRIIRDKYLPDIKSQKSLYYCMTIAYNAGISNLYKVFNKRKNKTKALHQINHLKSKEIYYKLTTSNRLTTEAKHYISSVIRHSDLYKRYD